MLYVIFHHLSNLHSYLLYCPVFLIAIGKPIANPPNNKIQIKIGPHAPNPKACLAMDVTFADAIITRVRLSTSSVALKLSIRLIVLRIYLNPTLHLLPRKFVVYYSNRYTIITLQRVSNCWQPIPLFMGSASLGMGPTLWHLPWLTFWAPLYIVNQLWLTLSIVLAILKKERRIMPPTLKVCSFL